jgi:hypothetical protein
MRNFFQKKVWVILLATLALGALTVLAVGLNDVNFRDGQHYSREVKTSLPPISFDNITESWKGIPVWKLITLWCTIGVMLILVGLLLTPAQRKHFIRMIIRIALLIYMFYYLFTRYGATLFLQPAAAVLAETPAPGIKSSPMPVFQPPHISSLLSYLISFACDLALVLILGALYLGWKRYNDLMRQKPLEDIAQIVRSSLKDLSAGRDSSDVVVNCYLRMSDVVADKRHLHREIAMTPQEFALRLERAGLPADPVRRLTHLFERVRYGDHKSAPKDVTEAVNCLNSILRSCGEVV